MPRAGPRGDAEEDATLSPAIGKARVGQPENAGRRRWPWAREVWLGGAGLARRAARALHILVRWVAGLLLGLGGAALLLLAADLLLSSGRVHKGVKVGGEDLGGLEKAAARETLGRAAGSFADAPVTIEVAGLSWRAKPAEFGLSLDPEATLRSAMGVGREGSLLQRVRTRVLAWRGLRLDWVVQIDGERLESFVETIAREVDRPVQEARIVFMAPRTYRVEEAKPGQILERDEARQLLARARPGVSRISLPVRHLDPAIGPAQIAAAVEKARAMASRPLVLEGNGKDVLLSPVDIWTLLRSEVVTTEAGSKEMAIRVEEGALDSFLRPRAPEWYRPPRDARFEVDGVGGETLRIVPGETGSEVDVQELVRDIEEAALAGRSRVRVPIRDVAPKSTAEKLASLGIRRRVSVFTTTFDPTNAPRVGNITLLARALDGQIVLPGEVFSVNRTTGPRTAAKGYQTAPVIVKGELVPGIGGGVCQVGTTLFNAVFFSGLEVVERHNHELYISKYPLGRDATLDYPGLDLKFRNDTPYGVLIKAWVTPSSLTIALYSGYGGRRVEFTTSERFNFVEPGVKYVDDPTLPAGTEIQEEKGSPGFSVVVTRYVWEGDRLLHKDTFFSRYSPYRTVVRRGTGPPRRGPEETASP